MKGAVVFAELCTVDLEGLDRLPHCPFCPGKDLSQGDLFFDTQFIDAFCQRDRRHHKVPGHGTIAALIDGVPGARIDAQ